MQIVVKNIQELHCGYWNASLKESMFSLSPNESLLICNEQTLSCTASLSGKGGDPDWCSYLVLQYFSSSLSVVQHAWEHCWHWSCALPVPHRPFLFSQVKQPSHSSVLWGPQEWVPAWCPASPGGSSPQQLLLQKLRGYQDLVASQKHREGSHGPLIVPSPLFFSLTCNIWLFTKKAPCNFGSNDLILNGFTDV